MPVGNPGIFFAMKTSYFFIVILGCALGCTGSNSSPGLHKTKERPSAAIEPNDKSDSTPPVNDPKKKLP